MTNAADLVHYLAGGYGRSYYATICGLDDETNWVTLNKSSVTCEKCKDLIQPKNKK